MSLSFAGSVLIVDPNPDLRLISERRLAQLGFSCYATDTLDSAVKLLRRGLHISAVLLDVPPTNELRNFVARAHAVSAETKLIGIGNRDARAFFESAGVAQFVNRPWTMRQLEDVLACDTDSGTATRDYVTATRGYADRMTGAQVEGPRSKNRNPYAAQAGAMVTFTRGVLTGLEGTLVEERGDNRALIRLDSVSLPGVFIEVDESAFVLLGVEYSTGFAADA